MAHMNDVARSPDQPVKRAPVVYGKRSDRLSPSRAVPEDERQPSFESRRVRHALQRRQPSSSPSAHASESEHERNPDAAGSFQFGFRHQLKELDKEFDHRDAQSFMPGPSLSSEAVHSEPSQVEYLQSVSMGTSALSPEALPFSRGPPPASPAVSFRATPSQESPEYPPVHRRRQRVLLPLVSDSEAEVQSKSSSVSPIRHAITTPHSHSSPTPPTSGDILMAGKRTKGKAPVRDVLPLVFDDGRPSTTEPPSKSKKGKGRESSARPRIKAPTKKERREAAFESSRIAASRPVQVTRTQGNKVSLSAFLAGLRQDNIVVPTSGAELPSDPIEKFSSPTDRSVQALPPNSIFGAPTGLLKTSIHGGTSNRPSSSERTKDLPPAANDSDDEIPSVTSIIQASGKQRKLQEMKQAALQHADTSKALGTDSEDDDLLVVKDDMHAVAREEAAQRRLDKAHHSPVKDLATLRRINHPSVRPAVISPPKLSRRELEELAKPTFARKGKGPKGQLTKKQLDQLMITQHNEEQLISIRRREEEWIKGGGLLSRKTDDGSQTSLSQQLGTYAELGLMAMNTDSPVGDEASADESDEDYTPDLRGSGSPEPMDTDEPGGSTEVSRSQVDDEEEVAAPLRRKRSSHRYPRAIIGSDDEGGHQGLPGGQRDPVSSMEFQTEDENDKENSAKLMYDRSEDKENKAVVRHESSFSEIAFGSKLGSPHGGVQTSLSLPLAKDLNDTTSSPKGDIRPPLKDISKDEDDFFLSPPSAFTESLSHSAASSSLRPSPSTTTLGSPPVSRSQRICRVNRLSLDSENDENEPSGFRPPQPSFLERLRSQVSPEPSLGPINPLSNGGFSQLFSAEDQGLTKPIDRVTQDELSLTLDIGLKPALEVSSTLRQKAESIFEKEQDYVVAAAVQADRLKEVLYVNDHGFLTQTRPECSSPQVYRMTPSQASKFIGTQVRSSQAQPFSIRAPLRTLSFTTAQEVSPEVQPLRRLRRRSPSPLEQRSLGQDSNPITRLNAFDILSKALKPPSKAQKDKPGKSEFVAVEAEESDEDDMFGFGVPKKDDGEEDDDNDQDKIIEGLVDDTTMDVETEAADLVLEKHREHEEEADQQLQKLHQDAVEGKFRMKRRNGGFDLEDESDEEDDDDARRIRQRIYKKRKIEGDSLEALGKNEETRPFYDAYRQDLIDEDDEFGHLREDTAVPANDDETQAVEPEEQETVSVDEIRQRVREVAQNNFEFAALDPEDTSWIDQSMNEIEDGVRVKVVEYRRSKTTGRYLNASQMGFDVEHHKRHKEDEQERNQLTSWAKNQSHRYQGTGRSGNSAAITSHTAKVKAGGGSLRSTQPCDAMIVRGVSKTKKTLSLLSMIPNREDKFA